MKTLNDQIKKVGGTLENWFEKTITFRSGKPSHTIVIGYIHGDKRWEDGVLIFTSKVENISSDESSLETANTVYNLGTKLAEPPAYDSWRHRSYLIPPTREPYEVNDSGELDW